MGVRLFRRKDWALLQQLIFSELELEERLNRSLGGGMERRLVRMRVAPENGLLGRGTFCTDRAEG